MMRFRSLIRELYENNPVEQMIYELHERSLERYYEEGRMTREEVERYSDEMVNLGGIVKGICIHIAISWLTGGPSPIGILPSCVLKPLSVLYLRRMTGDRITYSVLTTIGSALPVIGTWTGYPLGVLYEREKREAFGRIVDQFRYERRMKRYLL